MIKRPLVLWLMMSIGMVMSIFIKARTGGLVIIGIVITVACLVRCQSGKTYIYKGHRFEININKYDKAFFVIGIILMLILGIKSYNLLYNHNHDEDTNQTVKLNGKIIDYTQRDNCNEYLVKTDAGEKVQVYEYYEGFGTALEEKSEVNDDNVPTIGSTVVVHGKRKSYEKATNPGQFDEYNYYRLVKGYCYRVNAVSVKTSSDKINSDDMDLKLHIKGFFLELKHKLLCQVDMVFEEKDAGLVKAMVLGEKSFAEEEVKKLYTDSGIIHLMVISGTHISLLAMCVYGLLKRKLKVRIAALISLLVTIFYVSLTGFTVSSNRAVIMLFLFLLAKTIMRAYDMKSAIGLSGLVIMFINPLSVLSTGFILSFLAVVAIAYPFEKCVEIINEDMKNRKNKKESSVWGKYEFLVENFKKSVILSGLINAMTLPVVLYTYFKYPLYSIIINVIVAPFMPYLIVISIFAIVVSYIWLPIGQFLAGSIHYILLLYEKVCQFTSKLPFHEIRTGRPKVWQIVMYYLVILVLIILIKQILSKIKPIYKKSSMLMIFVGCFILCGCFLLSNRECGGSFVRMLDVGQGDCFFINSDDGISCLMDGGSTSNMNVGGQIIEKYLMSINEWEIDYVFISHFDGDHISGILQLIENKEIKIKNIVVPYMEERDMKEYEEYLNVLKSSEANIHFAREGMIVDKGNLKLLCLNPSVEIDYSSSNAVSACYYVESGEMSYLFTGDVCGEGEENLVNNLAKYSINHVDLLKVAHHGSNSSTSRELLELIKPKVALISCGKDNFYGHPHKEVIEMLKEIECKIVITAENGSYKWEGQE